MTTDPRIVLASKAIRSQLHTRNEVTMAEHALAAADAVMFSLENLSRAASALPLRIQQVMDVVAELRRGAA